MNSQPVAVTIYHNPECGTSRNTLALIRNASVEPTIIEYLKTPPDRATLPVANDKDATAPSGRMASTPERS
jgi:arsenate reductase-like glutaredoxin family protein